jgi:hypothetical protein
MLLATSLMPHRPAESYRIHRALVPPSIAVPIETRRRGLSRHYYGRSKSIASMDGEIIAASIEGDPRSPRTNFV